MRSAKRLARRKAGGSRIQKAKSLARTWLFPPALWEIGRRIVRRNRATKRALSPPTQPTPLVNILFPQPGAEPHWIPVEKIRNIFGQSFSTEQHHFVRYLESGFDDFERYYRVHQPETERQARFIDKTLPGVTGTGVGDAPWLPAPLAETATPWNPVHFGPVSDLELATEAACLDEALHSIKKYGFLAGNASRLEDEIMGRIFLKDNGDFRIVISNGNHRTAVLTHLGWKLIPAHHPAAEHPVRLSDLSHWPGVVDGGFTKETAHAMFEAFFRPRHQQLLPGW